MSLQGTAEQGQDPALEVVFRQPSAGRAVTWTGPGFARVPTGAGLRFAIDNIPLVMDFSVTIRYEPEVLVMACMSCHAADNCMVYFANCRRWQDFLLFKTLLI